MKSERWSTEKERKSALKAGAAGPVVSCKNGNVFSYDGEGHVMFLGVSGSGKSRRGTIPMTMTIIKNKESGVIIDPKAEIYNSVKDSISDDTELHVIDFRDPYSEHAETWNPLYAPYILWKSRNPRDQHLAEQMIEELAHAMYPDAKVDPFWIKEARNVFVAAVYALFEVADESQINLTSVYYFISKGEERFGPSTFLSEFVKMVKNENVEVLLRSYISTANDTKGGIRSEFLDGLSVATRSASVRRFLNTDRLHINKLRGDKPTLVFIILPDETPIYDDLAGVLVSQLMTHYVRLAEKKYAGKLPIRLNCILEELGNIGRAISNLGHLLSAGRSRNIRVALVLQALEQLSNIYGKNNATTIISNCDVRISFRINNWDTLAELSRLCGEKIIYHEDHPVKEPLILPTHLNAMETGQALVMIAGRIKFITWLPDFKEMKIIGNNKGRRLKIWKEKVPEVNYFDIIEYVKSKKKDSSSFSPLEGLANFPFFSEGGALDNGLMDINDNDDSDISIHFLDQVIENDKEEPQKTTTEEKVNVTVISVGDVMKTTHILLKYASINESLIETIDQLQNGKYKIHQIEKEKATNMVNELSNVGTLAIISDVVPKA